MVFYMLVDDDLIKNFIYMLFYFWGILNDKYDNLLWSYVLKFF